MLLAYPENAKVANLVARFMGSDCRIEAQHHCEEGMRHLQHYDFLAAQEKFEEAKRSTQQRVLDRQGGEEREVDPELSSRLGALIHFSKGEIRMNSLESTAATRQEAFRLAESDFAAGQRSLEFDGEVCEGAEEPREKLKRELAALLHLAQGEHLFASLESSQMTTESLQAVVSKFDAGVQGDPGDMARQEASLGVWSRCTAALHLTRGEVELLTNRSSADDLQTACDCFEQGLKPWTASLEGLSLQPTEHFNDLVLRLHTAVILAKCLVFLTDMHQSPAMLSSLSALGSPALPLNVHGSPAMLLADLVKWKLETPCKHADLNQRLAAARCLVEGELCLQQRDFDAAAIRFQDGVEVEATQSDTDLAKRLRTALALAQGEQELKLMKFSEAAVSLQRGQEYVHTDKELTSRLAAMVQFEEGMRVLGSRYFQEAKDKFEVGLQLQHSDEQIQQRLAAALHLAQGEMRLVLRLPEDLERACSEFKAGEEGVRDADPELEKRLLASSCLADGMRHLHDHRLNTALLAFAIGIAFGSEDADLNQRLAAARCLVEGELCLQQRDFDAAAIRFQDGVKVEATPSK